MQPFCFFLCFLLCHLLPQPLFLFSAKSLSLQPLPTLYFHHIHPSLGNDLSEVALQFDDTVEASSEPLTCNEPTAVSLEPLHTGSHDSEVSCELASSPGGLKSVETPPHLVQQWLQLTMAHKHVKLHKSCMQIWQSGFVWDPHRVENFLKAKRWSFNHFSRLDTWLNAVYGY